MGLSVGLLRLIDDTSVLARLAITLFVPLLALILWIIRFYLNQESIHPGFPLIALSEDGLDAKDSWFKQGRKTIAKGLETCSGRPFQVLTGTGPKICLPNHFADEVKSRTTDLSLRRAFEKEFFHDYPGFQPFAGLGIDGNQRETSKLAELVRIKLTPSLGLIIHDIVDETTAAVHDLFGETPEWRTVALKPLVQQLVPRLSSRAFVGLPLCRNERWLELARHYTVNAFAAARALRQTSWIIRPVAHWLMAPCIKLRKDYKDARALIGSEVEQRIEQDKIALKTGSKRPKTADAIGWMGEMAREKRETIDYCDGQMELTLASVHTTTEFISSALIDVIAHPEIIPPLREEIMQVIQADGWSKNSLHKLRIMDSFLKENQRCHPMNAISMNRFVKTTFRLSDGTIIPRGARIIVATAYNDPKIYPNPEVFDPYRFVRSNEKADRSDAWQHTSVRTEHMAWGYGNHACPGRFFVNTEVKIALAHLLLKYDWATTEDVGTNDGWFGFETNIIVRPDCRVRLRRREEEIVLDLPM